LHVRRSAWRGDNNMNRLMIEQFPAEMWRQVVEHPLLTQT
jgi:hypothetical protein